MLSHFPIRSFPLVWWCFLVAVVDKPDACIQRIQFYNIYNGDQNKTSDLLGHHHLDEFFVVDLTISINISFTDHFIDFFIGEFFSQIGHDVS